LQNSKISDEKSSVLEDIGLKEDNYGILTLHRESNVEDGETLGMLIEGVEHFAESEGIEIIFPCHPRTKEKLQNLKIETAKINLISPLGYLDFLKLQKNTAIMLTDSGGIQEECTVLKTPCVTLREETERPESIEEGFNILAGPEPEDILEKSRQMIYKEIKKDSPYGDGKACKRILIDLLN
jgi:UDP-N-acetylglucosamine 2-epimerase (non-hydrolysing)